MPLSPTICYHFCSAHHRVLIRQRIALVFAVSLSCLELLGHLRDGIVSGQLLLCCNCVRLLLLTVREVSTPIKGGVVGDGNHKSPCGGGLTVRFQLDKPLEEAAAATSTGSDGSTSTGSLTSSGQSLLQNDRSHTTTPSQGHVNMQSVQHSRIVKLS